MPALMNPANAGKTSPPGAEAASATAPTEGGEGKCDSSQSQITPLSTTQGFSGEAEARRSLATGTEPCGLTLRSLKVFFSYFVGVEQKQKRSAFASSSSSSSSNRNHFEPIANSPVGLGGKVDVAQCERDLLLPGGEEHAVAKGA